MMVYLKEGKFGPIDEHGKIVERTKDTHPYSYDGFVQERVGENSEANWTVWSDRLLQQDYDLTRNLMEKHFRSNSDNAGDWWDRRSAAQIEGFLRERLKNPKLRVILVMEYCNQSSGYPLWRFDVNTNG